MHGSHFGIGAIVFAFLVSAVSLPRLRWALAEGGGSWGASLAFAFFLPTTAVAIGVLLGRVASQDPLRGNYARFRDTYELVLNGAVAFVVGMHLIVLAMLLGGAAWIGRAPSLLVGVLLVVAGNVLPRIRPNLLMGARTPWTLGDERA